MEIGDIKINLAGLLHGADIDNVDDIDMVLERAANTMLAKIDPIDTLRLAPLSATIHDDVYNYALPSDYKDIVDLIPQDNRSSWDKAVRNRAGQFDRQKALKNRTLSIEASEGSKIARINWRSRAGKLLNACDSLTDNGTWSVVATATGLTTNSIFKKSGTGSIEFDVAADNDGIQNTTMTQVDLTDEDEVADIFVWMYFGSVSALTSVSAAWGNDLTTKYWTSTAQTTQADGTAFKVGWNLLKFSWATATETGTVAPATIDSFKLTIDRTAAIANIRVDNIIFSIGRNFDLKYYSKYLLKNSSGTWIRRTTSDADTCVLDSDAIQIYLLEILIAAAEQVTRKGNVIDIGWAENQLNGNPRSNDVAARIGLYGLYRKDYPSMSKRVTGSYTGLPRFNRYFGRQ